MTTPHETPTTETGKDPALHRITLMLCGPCLSGAGGECHSPGCSLWMNRAPDGPILSDADGIPTGAGVWVEFNDIDHIDGGEFIEVTCDLTVGQQVTAGDYEGNRCPAVVVDRKGDTATLRLDLDRFQDAGTTWKAIREATV